MANLYEALSNAETGGEENPWIRTKFIPKGGSSAFGPVQITRGLINDALNRNLLSEESAGFAQDVMVPMQTQFLKHGNTGKLPKQLQPYDYGGGGFFDVNEYGSAYENLANELIQIKMKEAGGDGAVDVNKFLKRWRGAEPEAGYKKRFFKKLNKKSHYRKD